MLGSVQVPYLMRAMYLSGVSFTCVPLVYVFLLSGFDTSRDSLPPLSLSFALGLLNSLK